MAEESGKVKVTIEVEVNAALMDIAKKGMTAIPDMIKTDPKKAE